MRELRRKLHLVLTLAGACVAAAPRPAAAGPGSGRVVLVPATPVEAGSFGTWTLDYAAEEPFSPDDGGIVAVSVPSGWSDPVVGPLVVPGHVEVSGPASSIDSVVVRGREIRVYAGASPGGRILAGDHLVIAYGAPPPGGRARAQTQAPATVTWPVASDPDGAVPAPLVSGSPSLNVAPAPPTALAWEPPAFVLVAGEPSAARIIPRDPYGNTSPAKVDQLLSLTSTSPTLRFLAGGVPTSELVLRADSSGVALAVRETTAGSGVTVRAADGDADGLVLAAALAPASTAPGPAAALAVRDILDPLAAGSAASVTVEAHDAHGNRATGYAGTVRFSSSDAGPATRLPPDYAFSPADGGIHLFAGQVTLTTAGEQVVRAEDRDDPQVSGEQAGITVEAGEALVLAVSGIADPGVSGAASDVEVEARDRWGNRAPGYRGLVRFATDDPHPGAVVPGDYTFAAADSGRHRFPGGVVLMTAGVRVVVARDRADPLIAGIQTGIDVAPGPPASGVLEPAGAVRVSAGASQPVALTVRDAAGNPVPGEPATVAILGSPDGMLVPDPAHPGGTAGTPSAQSGRTDAAGRLRVRYVAPIVAGLADSLDAWTAGLGAGTIDEVRLTSSAGGATRLALLPAGAITDTAFAALALAVEATDTYGNRDDAASILVRVTASSASARFSADGGASWSAGPADSLALAGGTTGARLRLRDPAAGTLAVSATDPAGLLAAAGRDDIVLRPAPAAGTIPLAVLPDTLTADGRSEAAVAGGPVADRHGNPVPGVAVTVEAAAGCQVAAADEDPAPGIQRRTDAAGRFSFGVRAAEIPGEAQISATAWEGTAAGNAALILAPRVRVAVEPGSLDPTTAAPGDTVGFGIAVRNLGPAAATFGGATVLRFADPGGVVFASTLAAVVTVPAGAARELRFRAARLDPALAPGRYTPLLALVGLDARGAAVDTLVAAELDGFALEALELEAVAAPGRVARGQAGVAIGVVIRNRGGDPILVHGVGLDFSEPAYVERGVAPALPDLLPGRAERTYTVTVEVGELATLGPVGIDARAAFEAGGRLRASAGARSAAAWTVESAARLAAVAGSLGPRRASAGQTHPAGVVIENTGGADVILEPALTRLVLGPPGQELSTPLAAPALAAGDAATALRFADLAVPGGTAPGTLGARLVLGGSEHGAPYSSELLLADSLVVLAPAALSLVPESLAPDSVSLGQVRSFSLEVANDGGSDITLRAGTVLRLAGGATVRLALAAAPLTLLAGGRATAGFGPGTLDPALGPGPLAATVEAATRENGIDGVLDLAVPDALVAERPSSLRWVAGSLAPGRVTRGQTAALGLRLANDGAAAAAVLAGTELEVTDGVHRLAVSYGGPPLAIAGGAAADIGFPGVSIPPAFAAQAYAPALAILVTEHGLMGAAAAVAPAGELVVEAPADLRYLPGSLAPPVAVAGEVVGFRIAVENRGGAGARPAGSTELAFGGFSARLDTLRSTAEISGGAIDTLFFRPAALAAVETGPHAAAVAVRGEDRNGVPLAFDLDSAPDVVTVIAGAALRLDGLASAAPRGPVVNRGQAVTFRFAVVNLGGEAVAGATARLEGSGLTSPATAPLRTIAGGDTLEVEIAAAVSGAAGAGVVRAALSGGAGVESGLPAVLVPAADDTVALLIQREARLAPAIRVRAPAGAADGVVSGGSLLDLEVVVENAGEAPVGTDGTVELQLPAAYGLLGPARQRCGAGEPVPFAVAVPPGAAARDSIVAVVVGVPLDMNSGAEAQLVAARASLAVEAVAAARLGLEAAIVEPENAREGLAFPGQMVTVEARVQNAGTAAAPGNGTLALSLGAPELALAPGEPAERPFTVGEAVRFRVVAAAESGPPHPLSVRIASAPADENTGFPAAVERPEVTLGLATVARAAEVAGRAVAGRAVALVRGGGAEPVLLLTVANPAPAEPGQAVVLSGVVPELVRVEPGGGETPADEGRILGRVELHRERADGELVAVWAGAGAPALTLADTIAGQEARSYLLALGAAAGAPAGTYRLELGGPGTLAARDAGSGEAVSLSLPGGQVRSSPITLYEGPHAAPNPFRPERESSRVAYVIERDAAIEIQIFDQFGDRVWSRSVAAGEPGGRIGLNQVAWDGRNLDGRPVRNGVYHCRIRGGGLDSTVKIAAIR